MGNSYSIRWDFSFLSPQVLSDAVKNLSEIYLTDIIFSHSQICQMLKKVSKIPKKVVLDLGCCNLSDVPLDLLKAVSEKLEPNEFVRRINLTLEELDSEH